MMQKTALRKKATGEFLSPNFGGGAGRQWVKHINDAQLWNTSTHKSAISNLLNYLPETKAYLKAGRYRSVSWHNVDELGLELVTFDVILIDASKGYIG